ncbi:hypothetical protein [Pseudescherichia vulneris]|uniref:hypothetical protein n=1 Tax=Pseudescherichia vulneris TaxID=566 RepID=UPI0030174D3C
MNTWVKKFFTRKGSEIFARRISYFIQYLIFLALSILLLCKGSFELLQTLCPNNDALKWDIVAQLLHINTLLYVASALALSSGIQLAYMLVTHGPDEAIEPVMLGIASAVLLILSKVDPEEWTVQYAFVLLIMIICIAILFSLSVWMSKGAKPPSNNQ